MKHRKAHNITKKTAHLLVTFMLALCAFEPVAQADPPHYWPRTIHEISYTSAADFTKQKAMFHIPDHNEPVPLLVALHSWGGGHAQKIGVPYGTWAVKNKWAFLHPGFRGPNRGPDTTGSDLAIEDVISGVEYAKTHANIDENRIYLIGYSGGGHLALLLAGRAPQYWAGISVWGPIVDLRAWHSETYHIARRYTHSIEAACGGPPGTSPAVDIQYEKRSPIHYLHRERMQGIAFDINSGLLDGHNGPVPISHALRAFNAIAEPQDNFSLDEIHSMTKTAKIPSNLQNGVIEDTDFGRYSPVYRRTSGKSRLSLFQGGHKLLYKPGLTWLGQQSRADNTISTSELHSKVRQVVRGLINHLQ